ncbi:hypothetical protein [Nocardia mexicana]|uniref:CHAD domain-containing protein n=1 Tax=Nocardia mexicana TaxID=279262 RepID=A0A370H1B5_9NOCA|nr:hypothetical protein [Nocardia mexicana]RDI49753.1 hypothetical protein DFR68_106190 [Nocardia mexicana]
MLGLERRLGRRRQPGLEHRLAQLIEEARDSGDGATVERVSGLRHALGFLDQELATTTGTTARRRELGRLRREVGLLLADAHARAVLARDFG